IFEGLAARGTTQVTAGSIRVAGNVITLDIPSFSPPPVTGVAPVADPLAGLAAPTGGTLQGRGWVHLSSGSLTLNPGIYYQIKVSGTGNLTLNPGVYVIAGGGFTVTDSASLSGSGVLIYNAGSNYVGIGSFFGGLTFDTAGSINLTPIATGPYAGIQL